MKADNKCPFGRWLYGSAMPPAVKAGNDYAKARDLHAIFHWEAAAVLGLALSGKGAEALAASARSDRVWASFAAALDN